ncbi:MAG: hypothetical protein FJ164_04220 [Gammaproteobacteria bacterium]|nr:hypothetical protein [Gammaproteobacteria bacterium]
MSELLQPQSQASVDSPPYWQGLRNHQLRLQRCPGCGTYRHYPRPLCPHCHCFEAEWVTVSGEAEVCSWTTLHHAFHPAFKALIPCVVVTATLREGVRLLAPFRGDSARLTRGLALRVGFEEISAELTLPMLLPA